jgi:CRISPR-associated endonuclease/helicase Cas3
MTQYFAHTREGCHLDEWQLLSDHARAVAATARNFAEVFRAGDWAYLAGLWHDFGKMRPAFQAYLFRENGLVHPECDAAYQGKTTHADAGARLLWKRLPKAQGAILSNLIAGHHAGLYDTAYLEADILKKDNAADANLATDAGSGIEEPGRLPITPNRDCFGFQLAFFTRMLFSCLVDADYLDTEAFCDPERAATRGAYPSLVSLQEKFMGKMAELQNSADAASMVNACRKEILAHCIDAAERAPGLFSLTVPTGGGKTLSSLAFALHHAIRHGKSRIIFVISYTSIIEQNAAVFRRFLGDEAVLEHHATFDFGDNDRAKLASENWDAPLIVTTTPQLFDSLFSNRSSKCRKLHNLADSILIFDEVQSLPVENLVPCLAAIRELTTNYGASAVLCSATQPAVGFRTGFEDGLKEVREIIPCPQDYFDRLKRTSIEVRPEPLAEETIADFLLGEKQMLVVLNTRGHAKSLFDRLRGEEGAFHLSALMCPAHRRAVLAEIKERLREGKPCRVVSTQVVEAGVDIDFPVVWRALAGVDSIAQAAGRCNREGKHTQGEVVVFTLEGSKSRGDFSRRESATRLILPQHENDLLHPDAIAAFFREYYFSSKGQMDAVPLVHREDDPRPAGCFIFEEEARFALIGNASESVLVPYDADATGLFDEIRAKGPQRNLMRRAQQYAVSLYRWELERLEQAGGVGLLAENVRALPDLRFYNNETGLDTKGELWLKAEDCVV